MIIYIAAPYTSGRITENIKQVCDIGDILLARGHIPYIPHINHLWDLISPKSYKTWMRIDLEILSRCDAVLRIGGKSVGANKEVRYAEKLNIPVYYSIEELEKGDDIKTFNSLEKLIEDLHGEELL